MTAVLDRTETESVTQQVATDPVASWWSRAGALCVDVVFGAGVVAALALVALSSPRDGWLWWTTVVTGGVVIVAMAANRLLVPTLTGWSLGRALFGIAVVRRESDDRPVGPWRLLARDVAHLLDTAALLIGWFWPLWDPRNRTFADLLLRTEVRRVPRGRPNVRLVVVVLLVAALLAATGAGLSYLTVYRQQHAVDQAREQIRVEGPGIVEKILGYSSASMKDDFARARALVTDGYRTQLVDQQQAVEKVGALTNEYWVVTSSVLSVTADRATMLVFMQGQRQASQHETRFITATARVSFERSPARKWLLSDLTVLTKPPPRPPVQPQPPEQQGPQERPALPGPPK